jgi:2-dehydropantoate 2-reductase
MRFVIYGVGAIGGTFAAALVRAGHEVIGIARGQMLSAIRAQGGLRFRTPELLELVQFKVVAAPAEIDYRSDDVIILAVKGQDTAEALQSLCRAGVSVQPIVCAQNGVNNERLALRHFPNVYGMTMMLPADYVTAGEVVCYATPKLGVLDIGRYPSGHDATATAIADAFDNAGLAAASLEHIMRSKYGKLRENLANVLEAALGPVALSSPLLDAVRQEADAVYAAAGIDWIKPGSTPDRSGLVNLSEVSGHPRTGGSSTQSLKRGAGSIETDYLNGEIVLLGRLHGVPTPLNSGLVALAAELIATGAEPGSISEAELAERLRP